MSRARIFTIGSVIVAASIALFVAIYVRSEPAQRVQLNTEIAKTLLSLVFVGIVAMGVKTVVDDHLATEQYKRQILDAQTVETRDAERRADEQEKADKALRMKALATLTASYWNIKKSLKLIETNRSAKTYGEQMALVMNGRLELQQLDNDIMAGTHALGFTREICAALTEIERHLASACDEWRETYLELSHQQKLDEQLPPEQKTVPDRLDALVALGSVRANEFEAIHVPFETAANLMRGQVFPAPHP